MVIYKLSADFLSIDSMVYNTMEHIESPAIFKADGVYYLLGSQLTGRSTKIFLRKLSADEFPRLGS